MKRISLKTKGGTDVVDITDQVQEILKESKLTEGVINLFATGSTVGLTTIEKDPNLYEDLREALAVFAPDEKDWRHNKTWADDENNGAAHIRSAMFGTSLTVPFAENKLALGRWQTIVLIDFDTRPRTREVILTIL